MYFFNAVEDVDRLDLADILKNVERNLERVFILHCEDIYARVVLEKAQAVRDRDSCSMNVKQFERILKVIQIFYSR